jgi:hypothetical protein
MAGKRENPFTRCSLKVKRLPEEYLRRLDLGGENDGIM